MAKRATTIVKCDEVQDYDRQAQISEIIDENINGSEDIEVLTDARFRQNFDLMRYSGEMCDVEIVVEESKFKAHKLILSGCSPYFRCMFGQSKFKESEMESVSIDPEGKSGIKAKAVGYLIDYMYTGCLDLSESNVVDLIWAADLIQLTEVKQQGLNKLEEIINFSTYLDICAVGTVFCRPGLIQAVDRFIRTNFDEFVTTAAFYELPLSDFSNYLKHRNLKTETEETVLSAVVRWCRHNKLWSDFSGLSEHIQFDLISVKFICTLLREDTDIKSSDNIRDLLLQKMQTMNIPLATSKPRFSPHKLIAMPYRSKVFFVISFEGTGSIDFVVKDFPEIFTEQINSMNNYSICSCGNYVYLTGGTNYASEDRIESFLSGQGFLYNVIEDTWNIGPSLPSSATYGFGIVAFDQKLYFVPNDEGTRGQLCKTEVFDLDNPDAGWRITAQMNYHRSQVQLAVERDLIYAIGGMENGGYTSTVEVYDPVQQVWSEVDSMSQARCNPGVTVANGKIFVIGGLGDNLLAPPGALKTAEFYDPNSDTWTLLPDMYFARHSPAVAFKNNKLYVFGGGSPAPLLRPGPERTIEVFDFDKHEWFVYQQKIPGRANAIYVSAFFDDLEIE